MNEEQFACGGCNCGAIRFETRGEPLDVAYCHCVDCRGFSGAPVVLWVSFDAELARFVLGERKTYESSPGVHWGFCAASLTWEAASMRYPAKRLIEFHIGAFDNPAVFVPDRHWFEGERLECFDVADQLPRYEKLDIDIEPTHHGPRQRG